MADTHVAATERCRDEVSVVPRGAWGGVLPLGGTPYDEPPAYVRFVHTNVDRSCGDDESCRRDLRDLQRKHMDDGHDDINYKVVGDAPEIVSRAEWGALAGRRPSSYEPEIRDVEPPVEHVCFTHTTTETCVTRDECVNLVRRIQREQIEIIEMPDITFNFLIGGDGRVYEGRGWHQEPFRPKLYEYLGNSGIEIAYIGDFEYDSPPVTMLRTAYSFLLFGVKNNLIKYAFEGELGMSNKLETVSRKDWSAIPQSGEIQHMVTPVTHILFTHTRTEKCDGQEECTEVLRKIQHEHMEIFNFKDICYNFMIGADGRVYEGRGWNQVPDVPSIMGYLTGTILDVAYIGDFDDDKPPPLMLKVGFDLIMYAIRTNKISSYFECIHLV